MCNSRMLPPPQVESYSNQIEPVADALRYLTPLGFDVLTYVILSRLTSGRDKVKDDGVNISEWLQNLSAFNAAVREGEGRREGGGDAACSGLCVCVCVCMCVWWGGKCCAHWIDEGGAEELGRGCYEL